MAALALVGVLPAVMAVVDMPLPLLWLLPQPFTCQSSDHHESEQ